jgi:hypothetical protein
VKVLVCGGREFGKVNNQNADGSAMTLEELEVKRAERRFVNDKLTEIYNRRQRITEIIEGGATGADTCAFWWAKMHGIKSHTFRADWDKHGKRAGFLRNQEMLDTGKPDLVIAFPGGNGTADMVARAKKAGVEVIEYDPEDVQ